MRVGGAGRCAAAAGTVAAVGGGTRSARLISGTSKRTSMSDVVYIMLTMAAVRVLALALRGLERL